MDQAPPATLFSVIERLQAGTPWGSVLDAGTGAKSARWMAGLDTERWTAVSADPAHLAETRRALRAAIRPQDRLVAGNWADLSLLAGEAHDVVLAEYLLGAVEAYAPCFQESLFRRLRPLVRGRLYVLGLDPYVTGRPADADGRLVQEIGRFRDGCHLLAGETAYREYPAEWVMDRLEEAGLRVVFARRFPNRYPMAWVDLQLATSRALIGRLPDPSLAGALLEQGERLRRRAAAAIQREGCLAHGADYVIAAELG